MVGEELKGRRSTRISKGDQYLDQNLYDQLLIEKRAFEKIKKLAQQDEDFNQCAYL